MKNRKIINKEIGFNVYEVIIIVVLTAFVASLCSGLIIYNNYRNNNHINYSELSSDKNIQKFISSYMSLIDNYYEEVDREKIVNSAINAMYAELGDPYTTFLSEDETKLLQATLAGKYQGIGVRIFQAANGNLSIVEVFKNSPAEKAGLQVNDIFKLVDGVDVTGKNALEVSTLIKENPDKVSRITILRGEEEITVEVSKEELNIPSITTEIIDKENSKLGYIGIEIFSETTASQIKDELDELHKNNITGLIIDVRNNSGGYLQSSNDISELFLEKGKTIYSLSTKKETKVFKDETDAKTDYPIIVLINGASASASEILAGALKESYGATLVGEKTFGKGKVQQTYNLKDGGMVKYTSAKWLTPNGDWVDGVGIAPDHEVVLTNEDVEDTQLNKAIELLAN